MLGTYWIALIAWLVVAGGAGAETASTQVVELQEEGEELVVVLGAGSRDGMIRDAEVTILREAEPIVHPLTGEVLGVPQEPVGTARIFELEEDRAFGRMIKSYSDPQVGDLAEYEKAVAREPRSASVPPPEVEEVIERVKELEQDIAQYRKSRKAIASYPVFARQVWDELNDVRSYLVALDERLVELEARQGEDRLRLNSILSGEYQGEEVKEFTIRYSPDTDVKLRVEGTTVWISVEKDSLRVEGMEEEALSTEEEIPLEEEGGGIDLSFLNSTYVQAGSLAVIGILGAVLYLLMKRREDSALEELEDLDEGYLDDEKEEEF